MKKYSTLFICVLFALFISAQSSLNGKVIDQNNEPFTNLEVRIEQLQLSVKTDLQGFYNFSSVPAGIYAVSFNYLFDKEYRKVIVSDTPCTYNIQLDRRVNFEEITIVQSILNRHHSISQNTIEHGELESEQTEKDISYTLQKLGNVQVQSDAGNGVGYSEIRIRGIDPQHIQYNLNGIPLNDAESSRTYLVDLPDIVNSTDEINVYSGFVPGRSGPGAFGASVDLFTNSLYFKPFAKVKSRIASYHTSVFSLQANTGLFEDSYNLEIRLSSLRSNGFIDRSGSQLKSFSFCALKIKPKYSLRLNVFNGNETTDQAWNGLPYSYFNVDSLYKFNSAGTEKPGTPYSNEIDHYSQTHTQLFYKHSIEDFTIQFTGNFTKGKGYYENYKSSQNLSSYGLMHKDTLNADLIRQKWLDNYFIFSCLGIEKNWNKKLYTYLTTSFSNYSGEHFGQVVWTELTKVQGLYNKYYSNKGLKQETGILSRCSYSLNNNLLTGFDFQWRKVNYKINGTDDIYSIPEGMNLRSNLYSPKAFIQWKIKPSIISDFSYSYYQREPFREDILNNPNLKNESLKALDFGVQIFKKWLNVKVNFFSMNYQDYLSLSGKLNDTGDPLHINISRAYRSGVEWGITLRPINTLEIFTNGMYSNNKAGRFERIIPIYDSNYNLSGYHNEILTNVDLAFSPKSIFSAGFNYYIIGNSQTKHNLNLTSLIKYVGSQYLDISQASTSLLPSYYTINSKISYSQSLKLFKVAIFFQINNVLNEKYSSHGWYVPYSFTGIHEPGENPYEGVESSGTLFSKGLYPQALRHYSLGIDFEF